MLAAREPSRKRSSTSATLLMVVWCLVAALGAIAWLYDGRAQFATLGAVACAIVTAPTTRPSYRLTSPWTLILFTTYIGLGLRGLFITMGVQGSDRTLDELFLLGQDASYFLMPSLLHVLGLALVTFFYMGGRNDRERRLAMMSPHEGRPSSVRREFIFSRFTPVLLLIFASVGATAFVIFAQQTTGLSFDVLSAKRTTVSGAQVGENYESHGVIRAINSFSTAAFWVGIAYFSSGGRRLGLFSGLFLALLGLNAIALPFFASSRSDAAFTLIIGWVVYAMLNGDAKARHSRRLLAVMVASLLLVVAVMTGLRAAGGSFGTSQNVSWSESLADALVFNRNFGDATITAHIVHHVPEVLPYQMGSTLFGYLVAPIPREIWPEKPLISVGPIIGTTIYGNENSGVPPGMFGDMYLNFGTAGVLVGAIVLGVLLKMVDRMRHRVQGRSLFWSILYAGALFPSGMYAMNQGIGFMAFNVLMAGGPLAIVLWSVRGMTKKRERSA